jgi:hypothetical protein
MVTPERSTSSARAIDAAEGGETSPARASVGDRGRENQTATVDAAKANAHAVERGHASHGAAPGKRKPRAPFGTSSMP